MNKGTVALVCAVSAVLLAPAAASASTITVNSTADPSGLVTECTLHDAIIAASSNLAQNGCAAGSASGSDRIDFSLPNPSTIMLAGDLPTVSSDMDIVGPGSSQLTVDGNGAHRPFITSAGHTASISGMTITNGLCAAACGTAGGGIYNSGTLTLTDVVVSGNTASATGGTNTFPEGGGIFSNGVLHLVLSTVRNNTVSATNATNQNAADGGGIFNNGTLTLDRSSVSGNNATSDAGGGTSASGHGAGIDEFGGSVTVTQSTINGNSASATGAASNNNNTQGAAIAMGNTTNITLALDRSTVTGNTASATGGAAQGGGILASGGSGSAFTLLSSTISGNSAPLYGNIVMGGATQFIKNTIVSNPLGGGANCTAATTGSQGFNIDSGNTCGFNQTGDQANTDPMLGALGPNGGPTQTLALLAGSPAIDHGLSSAGEMADQRGLTRPLDICALANAPGGDGADIGAFEVQGTVCPPADNPPAGTPPTTTPPVVTPAAIAKKCKKPKRRAAAAKKRCKKHRK